MAAPTTFFNRRVVSYQLSAVMLTGNSWIPKNGGALKRYLIVRRFNDVRTLANSLIFEIDDSIRDLPGATSARKLLVSRALQYLDRLSGEASGDPSLQRELATAYERVGDVLGHPYAANLGDTPGALASYRKALAIRESLAAETMRNDSKLQNEIVGNYFRIANALEITSDRVGALKCISASAADGSAAQPKFAEFHVCGPTRWNSLLHRTIVGPCRRSGSCAHQLRTGAKPPE